MALRKLSVSAKLTEKMCRHIAGVSEKSQIGGMLLAGAPGIGKTSFINLFGTVTGIEVITIEVPHITEEHLINIPFILFNPQTQTKTQGMSKLEAVDNSSSQYRLVLAQSNLYTKIIQAPKMSDEEYLDFINHRAPSVAHNLFLELGGNETTIPEDIRLVRQRCSVILFLDEYMRQTSVRIRNILRGILNKNIGMHKIPSSAYVVYASNMEDGSAVEEMPTNYQFNVAQYKVPSLDEWFKYLVTKYQDDPNINLDSRVVNAVKNVMKQEHLSYTEATQNADSDIKMSPRRWEQLILYICTSLPCADRKEANSLMANIRSQFMHYQSREVSPIANDYIEMVRKLIEETSNMSVGATDRASTAEWDESVTHAIKQIMKAGGRRKHIPVVVGEPGIGKTTGLIHTCSDLGLLLVEVDTSTCYSDDAIGLPLPGHISGDKVTMKFSMPKLYRQIMSGVAEAEASHAKAIKAEASSPEEAKKELEEWDNKRWKYLIFFDELSRVDPMTFNSLRRVILEKDFGPFEDEQGYTENLKLPKEAVVVGALNPTGNGADVELLTDHFRDVIDVIPADPDWSKVRKYLSNMKFTDWPESAKNTALNIVDALVKQFATRDGDIDPSQRPFYLDLAEGAALYVSPREYQDVVATITREVGAVARDAFQTGQKYSEQEIRDAADEAVADALEESLMNPVQYKGNIMMHGIAQSLKRWTSELPLTVFAGLLQRTVEYDTDTLNATLGRYLRGEANCIDMVEDEVIDNSNNTIVNNQDFISEVRAALDANITNTDQLKKIVIDAVQPEVILKGKELATDPSNKVPVLQNVMFSLLYTLYVYHFSNERVSLVGKSLTTVMKDMITNFKNNESLSDDIKEQAQDSIVEMRSKMIEVIMELE